MYKIIALFLAFFSMLSSAFSNILCIGANETIENGILFIQDLRYGCGKREKMDIAYPEDVEGEVDVMLFVHGGSWISFGKESATDTIKHIASKGYIGAALSYTYISDSVSCGTILDEITMSLKTLRRDAEKRGISVNKYIIIGSSAGAQLATLYAYLRGGESGLAPAAVYDMCGPVALEYPATLTAMMTENPDLGYDYWGPLISQLCVETVSLDNLDDPSVIAALQSVSATHFIETAVPTLIVHGEKDNIIPISNAEILSKMLTEKGIRNDFIKLPNSGHGLDLDPDILAQAEELLFQYAEDYLSSYNT